jgi:hypothetical protein
MINKNIAIPFNDDKEKMRDFYTLSKDEFLKAYSYINSESYDMTLQVLKDKVDKEYPHPQFTRTYKQMLEKVIIKGIEYYQFSKIGKDGKKCNGDIFSDSNDIEYQRQKFQVEWENY